MSTFYTEITFFKSKKINLFWVKVLFEVKFLLKEKSTYLLFVIFFFVMVLGEFPIKKFKHLKDLNFFSLFLFS